VKILHLRRAGDSDDTLKEMIRCRARHCAALANPPRFPSKNETPASSNADASGKLIAAVHQVICTAITSSDDTGDSDHLVTHPGLTCILDSPRATYQKVPTTQELPLATLELQQQQATRKR
jgi:hypothetical protein